MVFGHGRGDRSRSRATPFQSGRIPTHESEQRHRLSLPAARAAPPASSRPFPQPGPSQRLLSWEFVSLVICLPSGNIASTGACRSRTNADDRLPRASLGGIEGGDGIVRARDGADVRPQSSVPHPLDDLSQLGTIGLDNEVDRQAVDGPRLGRSDDGYQRSSGSNQARGPFLDVAADDIEHQIYSADVFQSVVVEVDELLRAEGQRLLTVGGAPGANDIRAGLSCELRHHRTDCARRAVHEDALPRLKTAVL